ncbi:stage V sporulation protein AC [Laceyella sediminis]|uniref:Stage V sporulation protein AC n=1 Tax=Laceyella sediminis TaxID=573074 RepID=A0ABX5EKX0_9BACL|nr:stage V sporulation protein AC [Laceyella sediminis]PRZ12517.1 stage V sporulation protein AC [Laceyella sediminis]
MANNQKKKLTPVQQEYQKLAKKHEPPRPVFKNCLRAFIAGGGVCIVGQLLQDMYMKWVGLPEDQASTATVASLILLSVIFTSLGVYDKFGQWAGAGSAVPVTGFANSMASAAIEHRSEGMVLGVGGKMFKLAGSVIVFGTVAAVIIALLHLLFNPNIAGGGS